MNEIILLKGRAWGNLMCVGGCEGWLGQKLDNEFPFLPSTQRADGVLSCTGDSGKTQGYFFAEEGDCIL